jgi:predicted acyl esterase
MRLIFKRTGSLLAVACAGALVAPSFRATQQLPVDYSELFEKSEAMIAMRDGVKLHTEI